jgi:hypothetical protein
VVKFKEFLVSEGGAEIRVLGQDQLEGLIFSLLRELMVGGFATAFRDQASSALLAIGAKQAFDMTDTEIEQASGISLL